MPGRAQRLANSLRLALNQRQLAAALAREEGLALQPRPPRHCAGHVEHYYHFLFDLLLPLQQLLGGRAQAGVRLQAIGPLGERLQDLFPGQILLEDAQPPAARPLLGMNPKGVWLPPGRLTRFAGCLRDRLLAAEVAPPARVLLIERAPPSAYYREQAVQRGGGAERRSIVNHRELAAAAAACAPPGWQFDNVVLEELPWAEQIRLFSEAKLVIGQHGAGLANAIFMPCGGTLLEIGSQSLPHFQRIAADCRLNYARFAVQGRHIRVEPGAFSAWLAAQARW